jgi:hypothetical protein
MENVTAHAVLRGVTLDKAGVPLELALMAIIAGALVSMRAAPERCCWRALATLRAIDQQREVHLWAMLEPVMVMARRLSLDV